VQFTGVADAMMDLLCCIDGLFIIVDALTDNLGHDEWTNLAIVGIQAFLGDIRKPAALLDTFLLDNETSLKHEST